MPQPAIQSPPATDIRFNEREQIQYLLGNPPSWMMRYGIVSIAVFFVLLLTLSYFIRYPDVVAAKVVLVTSNPPIRILAKNSGRISELLVAEQQQVKAGQVLAVFENTANWRDVVRLESWLATANPKTDAPPPTLQTGALQDAYSVFSQHWKDFQYFAQFNGVAAKTAFLQQQIEQLRAINANLGKQTGILREEFALAGKEIARQRQLHAGQVISDAEIEKAEAAYLQQKRQLEVSEAANLQNQVQIRQLESQINDLQQGKTDNSVSKEMTLEEDIRRLRSAIDSWKQNNLIIAPIDGKVSLSKVWSVQQSATAGEEILAVVPAETPTGNTRQKIVGKATLPTLNAGKVQTGMRAVIRLDGLPAQEYGALEARVTHLAQLPQKEEFLLDLSVSDSLTTTYGKKLVFRQEMSGQVRIITEDRRVLDRIFGQLRDLLQNK